MGAGEYHTGTPYLRIEAGEVEEGLLKLSATARRAVKAYLKKEGVPLMESYAKEKAPWKDRTGTARRGLTASVYEKGRTSNNHITSDYTCGIQIYHTAYNDRNQRYGKWLEYGTSHARPYPILEETAEIAGAEVVNGMRGILEKYEGNVFGYDDLDVDNIAERQSLFDEWE